MGKDDRLIGLTLSTVGEGDLEDQFQDALTRALELLEDPARFPKGAKAVDCEISVKVIVQRDLEAGFYRCGGRVENVKEPKRRQRITGAYVRDGAFMVEEPVEQLTILHPSKSGGGDTHGGN